MDPHSIIQRVVRILTLIDELPNKRDTPLAGDLKGDFDFWFDGGAGRVVTGYNEYLFEDGTRATNHTTRYLFITIEFKDGGLVSIKM